MSRRPPPSTCYWLLMAVRETVPAMAVVMPASIFIASMVATVSPDSTRSPFSAQREQIARAELSVTWG